jgi:hypothetical protein
MQSLPCSLEAKCDSTFNVFVAYEDSGSARHAQEVCDVLFERLGTECKLICQMWRFDALRSAECCTIAAREAAEADLIMISSHGAGELPGEVKAWIELWLRDKGDLLALVALFDGPLPEAGPDWAVQDYLAGVAERGQISFFSEPDVWPDNPPPETHSLLELSLDASAQPFWLPEAITLPDPNIGHWGLNE